MTVAPAYYERITCRLCGGSLQPALSLTPTPPANAFVKEPVPQEVFPLDVMLCGGCKHAQLKQVVDPKLLFENYVYVSGTSPSFVDHFTLYSASIEAKLYPKTKPFAVEIGSNDAVLLRALRDRGFTVLGVEPAKNIAENARASGIPTIGDFFSLGVAKNISEDRGHADVIVANNVLAHIDDLGTVLDGVKALLHHDGLLVFEVQYVKDLLDGGMFDLCYHEHVSYHALSPLVKFLVTRGFKIIDADHVQTHGGSLRVWATHALSAAYVPNSSKIERLCEAEARTNTVAAWKILGERIAAQRQELAVLLHTLESRDCQIVGYGAPAKATTFCYQFGLSNKTLDYIVDDSPLKQGLFTPGLHIPVVPPTTLYDDEKGWPDYVLVLAWNFWDQLLEKHKALKDSGVHFIRPFPRLTVT